MSAILLGYRRLLENSTAQVQKNDPKFTIYFIAALHLASAIYGLIATSIDMNKEQEPVQTKQLLTVIGQSLIHVILIALLLLATYRLIPGFAIPWLLATFVTFSIATYYTFYHMLAMSVWEFCYNLFSLGVLWLMWTLVYMFHRNCRKHMTTNML